MLYEPTDIRSLPSLVFQTHWLLKFSNFSLVHSTRRGFPKLAYVLLNLIWIFWWILWRVQQPFWFSHCLRALLHWFLPFDFLLNLWWVSFIGLGSVDSWKIRNRLFLSLSGENTEMSLFAWFWRVESLFGTFLVLDGHFHVASSPFIF